MKSTACALVFATLLCGSPALATVPNFITSWGTSAQGLAIDAANRIYVVDTSNNRIRVFSSPGVFLTQWGSYGTGAGQFDDPRDVAVNGSGQCFVTDGNNDVTPLFWRIQKFTTPGAFLTQWGSYGNSSGQFANCFGVALDGTGNVYVADSGNNRIQKFTEAGAFVALWGSYGTLPGQFQEPRGVAVDAASGRVYVTEFLGQRVQVFTTGGAYLTQWGSAGSGLGRFNTPLGVAVDANGFVYVADTGNHRIQVFSPEGTFIISWGSFGTGPGQFQFPNDVAFDSQGNIYVSDSGNQRVQVFEGLGVITPTKTATWGRIKALYR